MAAQDDQTDTDVFDIPDNRHIFSGNPDHCNQSDLAAKHQYACGYAGCSVGHGHRLSGHEF